MCIRDRWAPLSPVPSSATLFQLGDTKFSIQVMQPWLIAPHFLYAGCVCIYRRWGSEEFDPRFSQPPECDPRSGSDPPFQDLEHQQLDPLNPSDQKSAGESGAGSGLRSGRESGELAAALGSSKSSLISESLLEQ
eukprot:TRINITY_DN3580_c0_g2_i12.p2 TRINITY_DN3580_c0_g2~~TRINITY_DN3580_c0_g2_i12.p2  ORF type:complete len:135 (-),score=26.58 TRINITY_DN3580_c0_g2_i12:66-470(-)